MPDFVLRCPVFVVPSIFVGIELFARLSAIVFLEIIPVIIYPSNCFFVTLFLVEAGCRTRLPKSGLPLRVCTLRLAAPTLLALSLDLNARLPLLLLFLVVIEVGGVGPYHEFWILLGSS